jgi:hypothetical protein
MITTKHPEYLMQAPDWVTARDCYAGERYVKRKGQMYLPATASHLQDGMNVKEVGYINYESYKQRAVFPDYVATATQSYIGLLNNKETIIELPAKMEFLRKKATITNDSLNTLIRKIHHEQLLTGRVGLLLDLPADKVTELEPYIAMYPAETIINWDDNDNIDGLNSLNLVVLDESRYFRKSFEWQWVNRYRVLTLGDIEANEPSNAGYGYVQSVYQGFDTISLENMTERYIPAIRSETLQQIPFVFINSKNNLAKVDAMPLQGLVDSCMLIYRGEADYRHTLYMQGQETLIVIGGMGNPDEDVRVGAGSKIDVNIGGDAKYIGVSSSGLSEMRMAIENDRSSAQAKAGQLLNSKSTQESGDALRLRMTAQTANLMEVALTCASGLERILRIAAEWMGCDPKEVSVKANLDFVNLKLTGQDFVQLMQAKTMGAPLANESIHTLLKTQNFTKLEFENELQTAEKELADQREQAIKQKEAMQPKVVPPQPDAQNVPPDNPANTLKTGYNNAPK